jgi:tetratricopeptide (TPR) repeat protein
MSSTSSSEQIRSALAGSALGRAKNRKRVKVASVRSSPGGYFAVAAVATFASLVLLRSEYDLAALGLIIGTWTATPLLLLTDRVSFDGEFLSRRGLVAALSRLVRGTSTRVALNDIERVEINALRTLRRGGSVRYRYRVEIAGGAQNLIFASGGKNFRNMATALLPRISNVKLDARALELRDHLTDRKTLRADVAQLGIASTAVLEASDLTARRLKKVNRDSLAKRSDEDNERARLLRRAANNLRVAGRLREAAEAFRRSLLVNPRDGWLIYEYARLLKSQASALGEARLRTRSGAALRLAATRGSDDSNLLARIGETFLELGEAGRARKAFQRALDVDDCEFRAHLGLAEASLAEGKLAHVIHHYNDAARVAPDKATSRLARREADYYSRLNDDEDYLAAELRRMNWLEHVSRVQQFAARVSFASLLVALIGSSINQVAAGIGWAFASSSVIAWSTSQVAVKFLATRRRQSAEALD